MWSRGGGGGGDGTKGNFLWGKSKLLLQVQCTGEMTDSCPLNFGNLPDWLSARMDRFQSDRNPVSCVLIFKEEIFGHSDT